MTKFFAEITKKERDFSGLVFWSGWPYNRKKITLSQILPPISAKEAI
ncbi:MAG TPA: hypothetical protein IAC25_02020 [Candidatus Enterenecus stercoripullorum]|nr:hypothetical protein [Candidatus Enterenecus stercoripullorum]